MNTTILRLADIAHARSGDKADRSDIGLFAWEPLGYAVMLREVNAARVAAHFAHLLGSTDASRVSIYPLPNLLAIKLVLNGALGGGAANSLRSDNLGKTICAQLLRMSVELEASQAQAVLAAVAAEIEGF